VTEQDPAARSTALAIIQSASDEERAVLLNWAQQVMAIRASNMTTVQKLARLVAVTQELGMTNLLLRRVLDGVQGVLWTNRGNRMRGVIAGTAVGVIASIGGPMAGIAAFGGAIAVPVVLLGAGAGAILAAVVDELQRERER
jgi:hypothetical protein